jgi:hypothetical protein
MTKTKKEKIPVNKIVKKFAIPGHTDQSCKSFCGSLYNAYGLSEEDAMKKYPCAIKITEKEYYSKTYSKNSFMGVVHRDYRGTVIVCDKTFCTHQEQIGKPNTYILSVLEDGTVKCGCKAGIFGAKRGIICQHKKDYLADPKKFKMYEIPVSATGKDLDILNAL